MNIMKTTIQICCFFIIVIITSCSGSSTYQGNWKALDNDGSKVEIRIEENTMSFNDEDSYDYTQNSINVSNGIKTYGINLNDGRSYLLRFPLAKDTTRAILMDPNENVLYVMSRTDYMSQEDLYKLN